MICVRQIMETKKEKERKDGEGDERMDGVREREEMV